MTEPLEVIDLVSSDDDDVIVIPTSDAANRKRRRPLKSDVARNEKKPRSIAKSDNEHDNEAEKVAASIPLILLDNDGEDHAIISYDILKQIWELNAVGALTCLGNGSYETTGDTLTSTLQHIQQYDKWSCGFRNLQMMLTAILPHLEANHALFQFLPHRASYATIPTIRQIQTALEHAWRAGFDAKGAQHYDYKIVGGKSKIGAAEVSTVLSYWGIDSTIIQFIQCRESRSLFPRFVRAYFDKKLGKEGCPFCASSCLKSDSSAKELLQFASSVEEVIVEKPCKCPLLPLYLQWEGHSVTIIGIEPGKENDAQLIIFDPITVGAKIKAAISQDRSLEVLRLPCKRLIDKDVQLILCTLRSLSASEKDSRRGTMTAVTAANEKVIRFVLDSQDVGQNGFSGVFAD